MSQPISSTPRPYGPREAAAGRGERDAETLDARTAEMEERERAFAAREQLISALQTGF